MPRNRAAGNVYFSCGKSWALLRMSSGGQFNDMSVKNEMKDGAANSPPDSGGRQVSEHG